MLPLVLVILSFLSVLGGALLTSTSLDVSIGDAYQREIQLRSLAEGGAEQARELLRVSEALVPSANTPFLTGPNYTVFLETRANNVLVLRSQAQIGKGRKTVEVSVIKSGFPPLPSALAMAGDAGLDPRLSTQSGIMRSVDEVAANATDIYPAASLGNVGNAGDYRVVVVNGDCAFGPGTGYGILLVRGRLDLIGSFMWNGLILVVGEGELRADVGARGRITGGMFMARTLDNNPVVADFDPAAVVIVLDRSETDPTHYKFPYKPISFREF